MMKRLIILFLVGSFAMLACNNQEQKATESETKYTCPMHPQIIENQPGTCPICKMDLVRIKQIANDVLTLDENQIRLGNIRSIKIDKGGFSASTTLNGRLIINPENIEVLASKFAGRVDKLFVKEIGIKINKGQGLYQIYSEDLLALQKEYLLNLKQQKAFPNEGIYQKLAQASRNKLELYGYSDSVIKDISTKEITTAYITVYATQSGVISEINISEGQYVNQGSSVLKIENLNSLWVEGDLYAGENANLKVGSSISIIVNGYENQPIVTKIEAISPQLNGKSQILTVRAKIANVNQQFQPGMQAIINLPKLSNTKDVISLPNDAVIRDHHGAHVWIKTGNGEFKQKMVEIGDATENRIVITKGVAIGDEVVISGAYLLTSEYTLKKGGNAMAGMEM